MNRVFYYHIFIIQRGWTKSKRPASKNL